MKNRNDQSRDMIAAEAADRLLARDEQTVDGDLLSWFRSSPIHIAEYLGMAKLSSDLNMVSREIDYPLEKLVADARQDTNIFEMGDLRGPAAKTKSVARPYLVHTALGLVVVSILGLGFSLFLSNPVPDRELRYTTAHGEERTIRLSDGTFVHLNTDSTLTVKFEPNVRLVELERGEAYFEVAKATQRPFRVRVGTTEFQDVGTAFDVDIGSTGSVVTVAEGRVGIVAAGSSDSARGSAAAYPSVLAAGQQASVSPSGLITAESTPSLDQVLAWTRQQIVFDREPIRDVVAEFNRYNDVPMIVRDVRIAKIAISGNFHVRDERAFVSFLDHLPGVQTSESEGMIVIRAKAK